MARELYSKSKLAIELGVDRRTLDARLDGIAPAKDGARNAKLYYMKDVFQIFIGHAEETATRARKSAAAIDLDPKTHNTELASAKLRREQADAELSEIKVAKERGVLIEAARVEGLWENLVIAMRAKMLSLPGRMSVQTAGMTVKEVAKHLDDAVREALDELSREDDEDDGAGADDTDAA